MAGPNKLYHSIIPLKNSSTKVELPKREIYKEIAINQTDKSPYVLEFPQNVDPKTTEEYQYYHPEIKKEIISKNPFTNVLYKNQWLIDTPIIGNIIKNKAYDVAGDSGGAPSYDLEYKSEKKYIGQEGNIKGAPNLVSQYFKKSDNLPISKYKPKSDYLEFLPSYSIKGKFDELPKKDINKVIDQTIGALLKGSYEDFINNKSTFTEQNNNGSRLQQKLGVNIGGHKTGLSYDKNINLPYVSISDAWDFSPKHYSEKWGGNENEVYIQSSLMHKTGNPFKVYDRFYFNPDTKEYIPDNKIDSIKKVMNITPRVEYNQNKIEKYKSYFDKLKK